MIDRAQAWPRSGLADDPPVSVALSLGAPSPTPADPSVVSNAAVVRPALPRQIVAE